jgi:hypothetical protein
MAERVSSLERSLPVLRRADIRSLDELPGVTRSLRVLGADYLSGVDDLRGLRRADLRYLIELVHTVQRTGSPTSPRLGAPEPPEAAARGAGSGVRTPAVSALLARECAVPGARRVLVLGTGAQARMALPFLLTALPALDRLMVYGADGAAVQAIRSHLEPHFPGRHVAVVQDLEAAAGEAEIIVAAGEAGAHAPVEAGWLRPGALSILVGHGLAPSALHRADRVLAPSDARLRSTGADLADADGRLPTPDAEFPAVFRGRVPGRRTNTERIFAYNA